MMATYHITVPIKAAHGHQVFSVEANNEAEALTIWNRDGGEFVSEEVEVTDLDQDNAEAHEPEDE